METFKLELERKERFYLEIEKENKRLKPYFEKFNELKLMMEETLEKVDLLAMCYQISFRLKEKRKRTKN